MVCARVIECLLNTTSYVFGVCQVIFLQMKSVLLIDVDARSWCYLRCDVDLSWEDGRMYDSWRVVTCIVCVVCVCVNESVSKGVFWGLYALD